MEAGRMKTSYGLYKRLGRDQFLESARFYSDHVADTVDATLDELESRWFDEEHTMTEGDKMVADYNRGMLRGYHDGTVMTASAVVMEVKM